MIQQTKNLKRLLKLANASDIDGKISCRIQYRGEEYGQAEAWITSLTDEQIEIIVQGSIDMVGFANVDINNNIESDFAVVKYPRSYGLFGGVRQAMTSKEIDNLFDTGEKKKIVRWFFNRKIKRGIKQNENNRNNNNNVTTRRAR